MLVHAVIEVPDDEVIDSRLPASISYMSYQGKGLSKKEAVEGYLEPLNYVLDESIRIVSTKVEPESVILFRYDDEVVSPEEAMLVKDILKSEFPDNKVLGLTSDIDFLVENADAAVDMLEKMIAHIKVMDGNQKKIILT